MAYLPDLTAPSSWELEAPQRRSRVAGVIVALFFALLLCAATALATAVYLDGLHIDAQMALADGATTPQASAPDPKAAADSAWLAGRKAGYKKGLAAGKAVTDTAKKRSYQRGLAEGQKAGQEAGVKVGYSKGWQDASSRYEQAWKQANPAPKPGGAPPAGTNPSANAPPP
jgi:hypothetical protein